MPRTPHPTRRLLALLAATAIGLFSAFILSSPASAHTASVKGSADCQSDGTYTVTWTINNDWQTPLSVVQPSATPVALQHNVDTVAAKGSATTTQAGVPGTATTATLSFKAVWSSDNYSNKASGSVTLDGSCTPKPGCVSATDASYSHTFDGAKGTATVTLAQGQKLCAGTSQDFSLASYTAHGLTWETSLPQKLSDQDSGTVDSEHTSVTLNVDLPNCYTQVDLIWGGKDQVLAGFEQGSPTYGNKILGSKGSPGDKSTGPTGSYHGGSTDCVVATAPPSESASPSASPSKSAVAPASTPAAPGSAGGLPVTGTSLTAFIVAAVVLIGGGVALFILARKRRATPAGQ